MPVRSILPCQLLTHSDNDRRDPNEGLLDILNLSIIPNPISYSFAPKSQLPSPLPSSSKLTSPITAAISDYALSAASLVIYIQASSLNDKTVVTSLFVLLTFLALGEGEKLFYPSY